MASPDCSVSPCLCLENHSLLFLQPNAFHRKETKAQRLDLTLSCRSWRQSQKWNPGILAPRDKDFSIPLPRKPLPGKHPQAPGGHKLTISLGGIGSKVENMAQHPEPQREEPRVMADHIPRLPPQPWGMLTHRNQGPTRHPDHTPQTRLSLQKGPKPAACPERQIYNLPSFSPRTSAPPSRQNYDITTSH